MKKLKYVKLFESWGASFYQTKKETRYDIKEINASNTNFKNKMNGWKIKFDIGLEEPVNTKEFIQFLLNEFENMGTKLHILGEVTSQEIIYDNTYVWFDINFHPDPVGVINIGMVRDMDHFGDKLDKFLSIYYSVEDKMWSYSVRTQNNEISYDNSTKCDSFGPDLIKNCLTEAGLI